MSRAANVPPDTPRVRKTEGVDTPSWRFRVDPKLIQSVQAIAKEDGEDASKVLRRAIRAYLADPQAFNVACANIVREARINE